MSLSTAIYFSNMAPKVWLSESHRRHLYGDVVDPKRFLLLKVTGASSGMGLSMTKYVLSQGDIAVATLRKPEAISTLTTKFGTDKLLVLKVDVTKAQDITDAFARAKQAFGRIDVVYNNAGYGFANFLKHIFH